MLTTTQSLLDKHLNKTHGYGQWPPDYNSGGENDLLIIVSAAVFGFPAVVIIIICLLRLRVHYLDRRDKTSGRRLRAEESTLLANEDAGCGGGCGAPMQDLKRRQSQEPSVVGHHSNHTKDIPYDDTGTINKGSDECLQEVVHTNSTTTEHRKDSSVTFNSDRNNVQEYLPVTTTVVDLRDDNDTAIRSQAVGLC